MTEKAWQSKSAFIKNDVGLVVAALVYYGRNHPRKRQEVEEELKNWKKEEGRSQ